MFRGLRAMPGPRARVEYEFRWLLRQPMRATFDRGRRTLTFDALLPAVRARSPLAVDLAGVVAAWSRRDRPAHKRVDGRRVQVSQALRRGRWSLTLRIRGENDEYAVRKALNIVHDVFVLLQMRYPDYLAEHFGMSTE